MHRTPPAKTISSSEENLISREMDDTPVLRKQQSRKRRCLSIGEDEDISHLKNELKSMMENFIASQNIRLDKLEQHNS